MQTDISGIIVGLLLAFLGVFFIARGFLRHLPSFYFGFIFLFVGVGIIMGHAGSPVLKSWVPLPYAVAVGLFVIWVFNRDFISEPKQELPDKDPAEES